MPDHDALGTLNWLVEAGADEAIGEVAVNRLAAAAPPPQTVTAIKPVVPAPIAAKAIPQAVGDAVSNAQALASSANSLAELKAAMEQIKGNSQLQAAREAVKQAMDHLKQTRNQLLLQADPNIQPILDKLQSQEPKPPGSEPPSPPEAN